MCSLCVIKHCSHDKEQMITLLKGQVEEYHTQLETIKSTPNINPSQ